MDIVYTNSREETFAYARALADALQPGSFIALSGELGAGKTVFAKGIAAGLGVQETVSSPTFTLLKVYQSGRLPLYHYDVYRLGSEDELLEIDFYEYAFGDGVCLCEWAERVADELPTRRLQVCMEYMGEKQRKITVEEVH